MTDTARTRSLDEIEHDIAAHRSAYLAATWRADNPHLDDIERAVAAEDAKAHEQATNICLSEWQHAHQATP